MDHDRFPTTRWSLIERIAESGPLAEFLERYRPALLAFLKHEPGSRSADVEDLVQGFIADKVLQNQILRRARAGKGRLRNFLIRSLRNYVMNVHRSERASRRAPLGKVSLEEIGVEHVGSREAESRFELEWARSVLNEALERMQSECEKKDMSDHWGIFRDRVIDPILNGREPPSYAALAERYRFTSPHAAGNRLVTAKRMYAKSIRSVISEYTTDPVEVEEELEELFRALSR